MNRDILLLLLAVLILSFAPLFARLIELDAAAITWWRCLTASGVLGMFLLATGQLRMPSDHLLWLFLSGILLGAHWWSFFLSIQYSSVSIGVVMLFTYPLFTALLEPLTQKTALSARQVLGGIGIILGVYLLVPDFSLDNSVTWGVFIGLFSALMYTTRNILTKKRLSSLPAMTTLFYQMLFALLVLGPAAAMTESGLSMPGKADILDLLLLALVLTLGGHGLMTYCFKLFSAATVGIVASLQVVFSSGLAFLILAEIPETGFYYGAIIIVSITVYELLPREPG